jgi:hypothetical protein
MSQRKYYPCQHCGQKFWKPDGFRKKYCSTACQYAALRERTIERHKNDPASPDPFKYKRECSECGTAFTTGYPNQIYCSSDCTYNANLRMKREQWASAYMSRTFVCKECGVEVTTVCGDIHRAFCCSTCAEKFERRIEHQTEQHKIRMKQSKRRREKQLAAVFVEDVSYADLYERDDGVCKICGLPVLYDKFVDNNWSGTIDHIIPLSRGGEHSMDNCQLAHRICNSLKSDDESFKGIDWKDKSQENNYWMQKYIQGLKVLGMG